MRKKEVVLIEEFIDIAKNLQGSGIERYPASVKALEILAESEAVRWLIQQANNIKEEKKALADMANESQKLGLYEDFE